jgi:membrane-bound metal-dependent hydrolase YbcI (DUF457 family)
VRSVLTCVAVIAVADLVLWFSKLPFGVQALLDEPAHVATGLVALAAVGSGFEVPVVLAILGGSVLIDLDHLPALLGSHILDQGTPRPYTHSLLIVALVAAAALLAPRHMRRLLLIALVGLTLHFFRDMAESEGSGVALLWPLSDRSNSVEYVLYAVALAMLVTISLARRTAAPGRRQRPT